MDDDTIELLFSIKAKMLVLNANFYFADSG